MPHGHARTQGFVALISTKLGGSLPLQQREAGQPQRHVHRAPSPAAGGSEGVAKAERDAEGMWAKRHSRRLGAGPQDDVGTLREQEKQREGESLTKRGGEWFAGDMGGRSVKEVYCRPAI